MKSKIQLPNEKRPQKNRQQARHLSPEFMEIMNFGKTPRENTEEEDGSKNTGSEKTQLFDIQSTLKKAMTKMLEESLELTRVSSKEA